MKVLLPIFNSWVSFSENDDDPHEIVDAENDKILAGIMRCSNFNTSWSEVNST